MVLDASGCSDVKRFINNLYYVVFGKALLSQVYSAYCQRYFGFTLSNCQRCLIVLHNSHYVVLYLYRYRNAQMLWANKESLNKSEKE